MNSSLDESSKHRKKKGNKNSLNDEKNNNLYNPEFELATDHQWTRRRGSSLQRQQRPQQQSQQQQYQHYGLEFGGMTEQERSDYFQLYGRQLALENMKKFFTENEMNNLMPPKLEKANCRYQGGFLGGCWGLVRGRIIFSNQH